MTSPRDSTPLSKQATIIVGLTVVGFMAFGLTLSLYRNILFEETLEELALNNDKIVEHIEYGYKELEYFGSKQFKDKFAKENLNRINQGENVLIITQKDINAVFSEEDRISEKERQEAAYNELLRQMPVTEHWKLYLFRQEEIEQLKAVL